MTHDTDVERIADLEGRIQLASSLIHHRLDDHDPNCVTILRALSGWSIDELAAGEMLRTGLR